MVAQDISRPLSEQGGVIVEVNAAPGLRMHLEPSVGISRPVGEAIVDMLFPAGENGRIPIVAVTGVNGKTTTTRFIAHILRGTGKCVGMTCTDGIFVNDRRIDSGDCSGPQSARSVLMNPSVDMAVFETARGGILREGLAFDYCDVAVVTNIGEGDHLGLSDINTPEELAKVKRCIVEAVAPAGHAVLNANDPLVVEMAAHCPGEVVFFAVDAEPSGHRAAPRRGRPGRLRPRPPGRRWPKATARRSSSRWIALPLTRNGQVVFQVENSLASIAAAWSLGIPAGRDPRPRRIDRRRHRQGARPVQRAGDRRGDGGGRLRPQHALAGRRDRGPRARSRTERRTCVYSTAGDRRDCDIIRQGELLGAAFDRVILYEDHYRRGRSRARSCGLFRKGLESATRTKEIVEVDGATKAAETALQFAQPGELVLLQADTIDETVQWLRGYLEALAARSMAESIEPMLGEPGSDSSQAPSSSKEAVGPAEIQNGILAESHTAAKL